MEALSPIPNPLPNDDEDVSWALSTAGALWGRGERGEALKWLRRAAEQASDVNDDVRALMLFKAAAEVAQASATTPPPPSTSVAPPPASSAAPVATAPSSFPPPATPQPSTPPPRRPPPSLPPRAAPPPVPSSRAPAAPPTPVPPARTAPPPAPARPVPSSSAPSPVTKQSRSPAPDPQISPAARSMPADALAAASAPARRTAPAPRASTPARSAAPGTTVPTRPVASRPSAVASTPPPAAVTERPPPPASRSGRAFEEVLALQHGGGGLAFDDLDENTQVLQAVRSNPAPRKANVPEIEESFRSVLAEVADEVTDPAVRARPIDDIPPDDQTGPISAPERTAVTKWTEAERAALMAAPDLGGPETTTRRFAPLLAHRIAVMASSTPGELRLVLLDADAAPPIGAAVALLVPCTAADGDVVAHLIGSLE